MAKKETGVGQSDLPLPENGDKESVPDFPVVGIGASAGGLVALEAFFLGMPVDVEPDMAFVLVQHLAPDYKSLLTDIIQRRTRMNVCEVTEGTPLQINNIYIIPPNHDMLVKEGVLYLQEPLTPHGLR
ncbi:MAG: chemotaxis protein CheB, partial [Chloroflexota bacterium]